MFCFVLIYFLFFVFLLFCFCFFIVLFLFFVVVVYLRPMSGVSSVVSVSRLSIRDCHFGFL